MQIKDLIRLIKKESVPDRSEKEDLENLLREYPYFQTARLLYLKFLNKMKDSRFRSELKLATCYSGDRRKLFFFINDGNSLPYNWPKFPSEEEKAEGSPFSLIDMFLKDKEKKETKGEKDKYPHEGPGIAWVDYLSYSLGEEKKEKREADMPKLKHQDVIDEFLEKDKEAPIHIELDESRKGEDPFPLPDLDKVEEGSFFSETLAKIYLKQKKYDKALEIIKKLHLVYPEKNIYFADQIKFLEKIVNSKK